MPALSGWKLTRHENESSQSEALFQAPPSVKAPGNLWQREGVESPERL